MIRLNNDYLEQQAVLMPWRGRWYLIQEGPDDKPTFYRSWEDFKTALYDLVDLEGWEVLT